MKHIHKILILAGILISLLLGFLIYLTPSPADNFVTYEVDKGINPVKGNPNAKITIIEFSDFLCPACLRAIPIIDEVLEKYDANLYYRNFPLAMHENSFEVAIAAECANEQGNFWEYHDVLFNNQKKSDNESLKSHAINLGLNEKQFNECFESQKYKDEIEKDIADAKALGVSATPTFFINGKKVVGANQILIEEIIEREVKK